MRNEENPPSSQQPAHTDTPILDIPSDVSSVSSSFLDEDQGGDTRTVSSYTYYSTWSSNFTRSNLEGPGRLLGNLYSRAGRVLEKNYYRLKNREVIKAYEDTVAVLRSGGIHGMIGSDDQQEHEKACEILLTCALSYDVRVQLDTFNLIGYLFITWPARFPSAFKRVFERENGLVDLVTFSWKRQSVEYTFEWLYWYKYASRCLKISTSGQSAFIQAISQFEGATERSLGFKHFEALLLSCNDKADLAFSVDLFHEHWNLRGIEEYVRSNGLGDLALVSCAIAFINRWERYFNPPGEDVALPLRVTVSLHFLYGIARSTRYLKSVELEEPSEYNALLEMWAHVFKLHHFLRSFQFFASSQAAYPLSLKSWRDFCTESLPDLKHEKLLRILLHLEVTYGALMSRQFPAEGGSLIDREANPTEHQFSLYRDDFDPDHNSDSEDGST
ncbi:hypothetical protein SCHPADRAFT_942415 [Schizopora paradoxa]|uniref:Uncharacterized protein n=1 Tax=Schizopora paradoxa TaxID=27342 RepID=A0A0H2RHH5_9AGAM|nr:hypothetical protein SCHPADRAFT_942415 [Schizopora paradoxa]